MNEEIYRKIQEAVKSTESKQTDPRILIVGATGAGKSSLVNAIFSKKIQEVKPVESTTRTFSTHIYEIEKGIKVQITDSPGYGEVDHDAQYSQKVVAEASQSHVVILVLKADEKGYDRDLKIIDRARKDPQFSLEKPLLISLNQIDKIKPTREWYPPYDFDKPVLMSDTEKVRNIKEKITLVKKQFAEIIDNRKIFVVPTMCDPEEGGGIIFGLDKFKLYIFQIMPEVARFRFAQSAKLAEKASAAVLAQLDKEAMRIIVATATAAASAVALNPIPLSDLLTLAPIQIGMIIKVGAIYGKKVDQESAVEVLTALGVGLAARSIFQGIISLIPIPGAKPFLGAPYAAAATHGMGIAARAYFKSNSIPSADDLRKIIEEEIKKRGG